MFTMHFLAENDDADATDLHFKLDTNIPILEYGTPLSPMLDDSLRDGVVGDLVLCFLSNFPI